MALLSVNLSKQEVPALRSKRRRHLRCLIKFGCCQVSRPWHRHFCLVVLFLWFSIQIRSNVRSRLSVSCVVRKTICVAPKQKNATRPSSTSRTISTSVSCTIIAIPNRALANFQMTRPPSRMHLPRPFPSFPINVPVRDHSRTS